MSRNNMNQHEAIVTIRMALAQKDDEIVRLRNEIDRLMVDVNRWKTTLEVLGDSQYHGVQNRMNNDLRETYKWEFRVVGDYTFTQAIDNAMKAKNA